MNVFFKGYVLLLPKREEGRERGMCMLVSREGRERR